MGVKVATTNPYNPRYDGHAEHTNRVVKDMLRSFVDDRLDDWDLWCINPEFAIIDSQSETFEFSQRFRDILEEARHKLEIAQQRQSAQFDRRHHQQEYQLGDRAWVEARHLAERVNNNEAYTANRVHGGSNPCPLLNGSSGTSSLHSQKI
ncbi:hypothetical protein CYMTET_45781 [Cymbomonas tetramitiformis]|uniref:Integrase catalytic domain-containing protein n=1 Tax=Cymbomonas tetramitiformis TaxID=36881 RepID=A0AAE0EXZ5_9CHLO|nr:hypothetical protein CYMTET_45781 [Cymbomonas tetramitiformis]